MSRQEPCSTWLSICVCVCVDSFLTGKSLFSGVGWSHRVNKTQQQTRNRKMTLACFWFNFLRGSFSFHVSSQSTGKGSTKNRDKTWSSDFVKTRHGDIVGIFPACFRKKIKILSSDEIKALLRGAPFTIHALSEFEVLIFFLYTMSCFSSVGLRFLKCSKIGHTRRWGLLTREITSSKQSLAVWVSARTRATTMMGWMTV